MSKFGVVLTPEAQDDIKRMDPAVQTRILDKLAWMGEQADILRHYALRGEEWAGDASATALATIGFCIR